MTRARAWSSFEDAVGDVDAIGRSLVIVLCLRASPLPLSGTTSFDGMRLNRHFAFCFILKSENQMSFG